MKPVQLFITLVLVFCIHSSFAQGPDWKWAVTAGGYDIACDKEGNVYLAGAVYDSVIISGTVLKSFDGFDIYIAKYDASGNLLWAKVTSGNSEELVPRLAVDGVGNIYVNGALFNAAANPEIGGIPVTVYGAADMFLAKYDNSGTLLWVKTAGGPGNDNPEGHSIAIDASGNVLVTGTFDGYCLYGNDTLHGAGDDDVLLAKYNSNGDVLWYAGAGGSKSDQGMGITTDVSGNVFLTGYYVGTATFGSVQLVAPDALPHAFLAQYDAGGQLLWAKTIYGTVCSGLVSDASGSLYLTGDDNLTQQRFVAKYDNSGSSIWVKTVGGKTFYASDINIDPQGNVYFCDDITVLAKFDNNGTLLWKIANDYPDNFAMLTADKYGNVYVSGDIDGGTVPPGDHSASGPHYLAKLSPFPASVPALANGIKMILYPNPSTGLLQVDGIDFNGYTVTDMTGHKLVFDNEAKNADAIDVSSLPAGNYLLHLQTAGKSISLKFTKQ